MEMRCPDDIGRDSWDWVGQPAWVRACFNSPEWGWRLLACQNGASPDCIIVVVVVVVVVVDTYEDVRMCTTSLPCYSTVLIQKSCKPGDASLHEATRNYPTPVLM